jgi:ferritin-like metal-binding protein YciE
MPIETLEDLLLEEIKDLYDAEKQITKALPKLAKAASSPDLKAAFTEHLEQTKGQITRLEEVFGYLGRKPKSKPCLAMKGLIEEGQEQTQEDAEGSIKDLMLIGAAESRALRGFRLRNRAYSGGRDRQRGGCVTAAANGRRGSGN